MGAGSVSRVMVGTEETRLIVLRGNSASGKSSVAACIRDRFGRGLALVGQDNLRRVVLRERDRPGAANIGLIDTVASTAGPPLRTHPDICKASVVDGICRQ